MAKLLILLILTLTVGPTGLLGQQPQYHSVDIFDRGATRGKLTFTDSSGNKVTLNLESSTALKIDNTFVAPTVRSKKLDVQDESGGAAFWDIQATATAVNSWLYIRDSGGTKAVEFIRKISNSVQDIAKFYVDPIPDADLSQKLGGPLNRWDKLYVKDIDMTGAFTGSLPLPSNLVYTDGNATTIGAVQDISGPKNFVDLRFLSSTSTQGGVATWDAGSTYADWEVDVFENKMRFITTNNSGKQYLDIKNWGTGGLEVDIYGDLVATGTTTLDGTVYLKSGGGGTDGVLRLTTAGTFRLKDAAGNDKFALSSGGTGVLNGSLDIVGGTFSLLSGAYVASNLHPTVTVPGTGLWSLGTSNNPYLNAYVDHLYVDDCTGCLGDISGLVTINTLQEITGEKHFGPDIIRLISGSTDEGGQLRFDAGGTWPGPWYIDLYQNSMRVFLNSPDTVALNVGNFGGGTVEFSVDGRIVTSGHFWDAHTEPAYHWNDTNAGTDEKIWRWVSQGNYIYLQAVNDAYTVGNNALYFARTGATPVGAYFDVPVVVNGTAEITGTEQVAGEEIIYSYAAPHAIQRWSVAGAPTNEQHWRIYGYNDGNLRLDLLNDSFTAATGAITFFRTGITFDGMTIHGNLHVEGTCTGCAGTNLVTTNTAQTITAAKIFTSVLTAPRYDLVGTGGTNLKVWVSEVDTSGVFKLRAYSDDYSTASTAFQVERASWSANLFNVLIPSRFSDTVTHNGTVTMNASHRYNRTSVGTQQGPEWQLSGSGAASGAFRVYAGSNDPFGAPALKTSGGNGTGEVELFAISNTAATTYRTFIPSADNSIDVGNVSYRFRDYYGMSAQFSSNVTVANTLYAGTVSANIFNDENGVALIAANRDANFNNITVTSCTGCTSGGSYVTTNTSQFNMTGSKSWASGINTILIDTPANQISTSYTVGLNNYTSSFGWNGVFNNLGAQQGRLSYSAVDIQNGSLMSQMTAGTFRINNAAGTTYLYMNAGNGFHPDVFVGLPGGLVTGGIPVTVNGKTGWILVYYQP